MPMTVHVNADLSIPFRYLRPASEPGAEPETWLGAGVAGMTRDIEFPTGLPALDELIFYDDLASGGSAVLVLPIPEISYRRRSRAAVLRGAQLTYSGDLVFYPNKPWWHLINAKPPNPEPLDPSDGDAMAEANGVPRFSSYEHAVAAVNGLTAVLIEAGWATEAFEFSPGTCLSDDDEEEGVPDDGGDVVVLPHLPLGVTLDGRQVVVAFETPAKASEAYEILLDATVTDD